MSFLIVFEPFCRCAFLAATISPIPWRQAPHLMIFSFQYAVTHLAHSRVGRGPKAAAALSSSRRPGEVLGVAREQAAGPAQALPLHSGVNCPNHFIPLCLPLHICKMEMITPTSWGLVRIPWDVTRKDLEEALVPSKHMQRPRNPVST